MGQNQVRLSEGGQRTAGLSQDCTSSYITAFPQHDTDECNGYASIFMRYHNLAKALGYGDVNLVYTGHD